MQDELREALEIAQTALNTWLCTYADDMVGEEDARAARERIREAGGTLGYISEVSERLDDLRRLAAAVSAAPLVEGEQGVSHSSIESATAPQAVCPADAEPQRAVHYVEADRLEYVSRDVPTFNRPVHPGVDVLLDMESREPIGWCIYGWSKKAPTALQTKEGG